MINIRKLGKKGKIIVMVGLLSVFAMSSAAFATSYSFNDTLPTFGHKTLTEGVKERLVNEIDISTGNCESAFDCWVDCSINGSETKVAGDFRCYANASYGFEFNEVVPLPGKTLILRTKAFSTLGGQRVVGSVDFN